MSVIDDCTLDRNVFFTIIVPIVLLLSAMLGFFFTVRMEGEEAEEAEELREKEGEAGESGAREVREVVGVGERRKYPGVKDEEEEFFTSDLPLVIA